MGGICSTKKIHHEDPPSNKNNANNKPVQSKSLHEAESSSPSEILNDDMEVKPSGETFKYTNLINRDIDFRAVAENIEEYFESQEVPNEKLRVALKILRDMTEEGGEMNSKISLEKFYSLIGRHYRKLYEEFEKINQTWKPLIKLLEIFELIFENFDDKNLRKEIVDRIYKILDEKLMIIEDWRFLRKLCEQRAKEELNIFSSWRGDLIQGFYRRVEITQKALLWKDETGSPKLVSEIIDFVLKLKEEILFESLIMGRFDKKLANTKESFSMIVGDEGGLFLLINRVPPGSRQEKLILDSGVSKIFLEEKRDRKTHKVIIGKGSFGKVRLALSILGSSKVDIGQVVCVKKSLPIVPIGGKKTRETNHLKNIADSTLEDFYATKLNESIHVPMPLDMAILNCNLNENKHRKGYLFMELVPENTADKIFGEKDKQKWEYQKPFILAVLKTTNDMLVKDRVFNSDLKPQNTLFDPLSRKMAIIDLGSSLLIAKDKDLEIFDASVGGFGVSKPYCPPEIMDPDQNEKLNLKKAISYLCGVTIAEVTCSVPSDKKAKQNFENWKLTAEKTDLNKESKDSFIMIIKKLTDKNPLLRMDISEAMESIEKIGLKADEIMKKATAEHYILKLRKLIKENPGVLSLNEDILETRKKGIIQQMVVVRNPRQYRNQRVKELNKELEDFLKQNVNNDPKKHLVLLGEAGSGKSLALQLKFIEEVEEWQYGRHALPFFFNMANEVNLEKVVYRLNAILGSNIKLEDPNSDEIHLFIDSYDEGDLRIIDNDKQSENTATIIERYFESLRKWKKINLVITCRTDFVQSEGEVNLNEFQVKSLQSAMVVRFITPIDYKIAQNEETSEKTRFDMQVKEWLKREKLSDNPKAIIRILKILDLKGRMGTGLLFNMIMKMTIKMQEENLKDLRIKDFEIYRRTIREEFRLNWQKVVSWKGTDNKKSDKELEQFKVIKELIQKRMLPDEDVDDQNINVNDRFGVIWEGMERIGELMAAEMKLKKSNRIRYSDLERLILEQTSNNKDDDFFELDIRLEWKTLYQILRIMGLKLEKRNTIVARQEDEKFHKDESGDNSYTEIGFRHETYKNYYLLRGFKRLLPVALRDMNAEDSGVKASKGAENIQSKKIVAALLEEEGLISNYELLRFCGEEVQNYKDLSLRDGLRKMLSLEQKKRREQNTNENQKASTTSSACFFEHKEERVPKISRSAGAMSLLVAGSYQFWGEDLGDLDLAGAYMTGGTFCKSKFERTCLRNANLRHADVTRALFVNSDLRALQLGLLPTLDGHYGGVNSVSFSPDGKLVASAGDDGKIKIWDSISGKKMKSFGDRNEKNTDGDMKGRVESASFSPDGKKVASARGDGCILIWDLLSEKSPKIIDPKKFELERGGVGLFSLSPDGKKLAGFVPSDDFPAQTLFKIYDTESLKVLKEIRIFGYNNKGFSLSLDWKLAAGISYKNIEIRDIESGTSLKTLEAGSILILVSFSPDGKKLLSAGGNDQQPSVKIWNCRNGECLQTLEMPDEDMNLWSLTFSPNGTKVAGGTKYFGWVEKKKNSKVIIWDIESGECIQTLTGLDCDVNSLSFSPDGMKLAAGCKNDPKYQNKGTINIWNIGSGKCVQASAAHLRKVNSVSFSHDGKKFASGSDDESVKIWFSENGECLQTLKVHFKVISVSLSPDGKKVACGGGLEIEIWDLGYGECVQSLKGHSEIVTSVSFSPDGKKVLSGSDDHKVKIWDLESGKCLKTLEGKNQGITAVTFSPDGNKVAIGSSHEYDRISIWDSGSGKLLKCLDNHSPVHSVSFSPDGKKVASRSERKFQGDEVIIWDVESGKQLEEAQINKAKSVSYLPDGKKLVSGNTECQQILAGHSGPVNSVSVSPCGNKIASGSDDKTVNIWDSDCKSGKSVQSVSFSPDWKKFANEKGRILVKNGSMIQEKNIEFFRNVIVIWNSESGCFRCEGEFKKEINKHSEYFLKWCSKIPLPKDDFRCHSTIILSCVMDKNTELDLANEVCFIQRNAEVYINSI